MDIPINIDWQTISSALVGGGLAVSVAQHFIGKIVDKIEALPEKLSEIKSQLSVMQIKLDIVYGLQDTIKEHDRRLIQIESILEAKLNVHHRKPNRDSQP